MLRYGIILSIVLVILIAFLTVFAQNQSEGKNLYMKYCATCHGKDMNGGMAKSLTDGIWQFGSKDSEIFDHIKEGIPERGMPAFKASISDSNIEKIIAFLKDLAGKHPDKKTTDDQSAEERKYNIIVETCVEDLDFPWAMDFIDDNTALITERPGNLRILNKKILQQQPVEGIPEVLHEGQGGLMDVAVDPEYSKNGWIYLSYSHVLGDEDGPAMTRIVRGKIRDNRWVDQQVIYELCMNIIWTHDIIMVVALCLTKRVICISLSEIVGHASRLKVLPVRMEKCTEFTRMVESLMIIPLLVKRMLYRLSFPMETVIPRDWLFIL